MRLPAHSAELALLGRLFDVKFQDLTPQFPLGLYPENWGDVALLAIESKE
jgi:hypothetical protein